MNCIFVGGKFNGSQLDLAEAIATIPVTGMTDDLSELRANGKLVHRAELDNQPMFEGYLGPMWDGNKLRYETQEVYNLLSE